MAPPPDCSINLHGLNQMELELNNQYLPINTQNLSVYMAALTPSTLSGTSSPSGTARINHNTLEASC